MPIRPPLLALVAGLLAAGCGKTNADYEAEVSTGMHDSLQGGIDELLQAAREMKAAAPAPTGRGWDADLDAAALTQLEEAWRRGREAYEHVEGALAPIFPEIDFAIDARYDDALADLGPSGDPSEFDDQGVIGMHAVERILFAHTTPARVAQFEAALPGSRPARWPATEQEAADFKTKLLGQLVADVTLLHDQWTPQRIDVAGSFQGLIALMNEQREKVNKASSSEEESRYSQRTMADIRDNLEGTRAIYAVFQPWLLQKTHRTPELDGPTVDAAIEAQFEQLAAVYAEVEGDAVPQPPASWSAESPSPADLQSPFGKLYTGVRAAVDPAAEGSVVAQMNRAAALLGFPQFEE